MFMRSIACPLFASVALLAVASSPASAAYDAASEYVEAAAVARRYPDPDIVLRTPGFAAGRQDFTSHAEMLAFLEATVTASRHAHLRIIGRSQQGRAIPLAILTRGGAASSAEVVKNGRPTLLIIGL